MTCKKNSRHPGVRNVGLVALALVATVLLAGCDLYAPGWTTIHADSRNSDYAPVPGADDLEPVWTATLGGVVNVGATFDQHGQVLVTSTNGSCELAALDLATGTRRWCRGDLDRFAAISSPLVDVDGRIFLADGQAMHAFDHEGRELWSTPIEGVPLSAQLTPEGRLLFMTHIGQISVLRREDGQPVLPTVELIPGRSWDPAEGVLACARGTAACPAANTLSMDIATGRFIFTWWEPGAPAAGVRAMRVQESPVPSITPLWTNDSLPGGSASSPTVSVDESRVYVNDNVGALHALDTATGATRWSTTFGYASGGSPSLTPGGRIMPAGGSGGVVAIQDEGTQGAVRWRRDDLLNRGIPTQTDGDRSYATVSTGSSTNAVVVLDAKTGAELDREQLPGTTYFSVGTTVAPDGTVLVPTITGSLFAFRPA